MENFVIVSEKNSDRIDQFIAENTDISRSRAVKLIESGDITLNGKTIGKKTAVKTGDRVEIVLPDAVPLTAKAEDIPLDIIYEDAELLVVNKPKGMVVHPAAGNYEGTLVNALLAHCRDSLSGIGGVMRPGIIHRIDKNTSGLLMVAKNDNSHQHLASQIKEHSFVREYEAIVYGKVKADEGTVNAPIGRHPVKRKQMAVTDKNSKEAVTHYKVIKRYNGFTHLRCRLETGRTHQIRVHMSYIGHPLAGDEVYGPKNVIKELSGQCLHAKKLGFTHPDGRYLEFESELPTYFKEFILKLEKQLKE